MSHWQLRIVTMADLQFQSIRSNFEIQSSRFLENTESWIHPNGLDQTPPRRLFGRRKRPIGVQWNRLNRKSDLVRACLVCDSPARLSRVCVQNAWHAKWITSSESSSMESPHDRKSSSAVGRFYRRTVWQCSAGLQQYSVTFAVFEGAANGRYRHWKIGVLEKLLNEKKVVSLFHSLCKHSGTVQEGNELEFTR